ncbi:hypothetical protein I3760_06G010000 [Carya illinoinensis]|nr:hypothetical protein I3760_06G010000 [Carya illinoinensis]
MGTQLDQDVSAETQILRLRLKVHPTVGTLETSPFQGQMFQQHPQTLPWEGKLLFSEMEQRSQSRDRGYSG